MQLALGKLRCLLKPVVTLNAAFEAQGFVDLRNFFRRERCNLRIVENADIVQNCDAVSTVHGTPGYELPLQGARAIIAGQSRYSGLGIAEQPTTEGEYLDSLLGKFDRNFDDASAKSAALMFAATEFNVFRCPSLFIRTDKVRVPPNAPFWREEAVSVSTLNVEDDPFFWALKDMCEMNRTHMLRLSFFEQ